MKTSKRVRSAVAAGIAYLFATRDRAWPGKLNPDSLDMSSGCDCLLGQLEGNYDEAKKRLGIKDGSKLGFHVVDDSDHFTNFSAIPEARWRVLTSAWRSAIRRLQKRAA